jgi:hypothetical protein
VGGRTFTILTTESDDLLASLHDRLRMRPVSQIDSRELDRVRTRWFWLGLLFDPAVTDILSTENTTR